jgi:hypothetical protein
MRGCVVLCLALLEIIARVHGLRPNIQRVWEMHLTSRYEIHKQTGQGRVSKADQSVGDQNYAVHKWLARLFLSKPDVERLDRPIQGWLVGDNLVPVQKVLRRDLANAAGHLPPDEQNSCPGHLPKHDLFQLHPRRHSLDTEEQLARSKPLQHPGRLS